MRNAKRYPNCRASNGIAKNISRSYDVNVELLSDATETILLIPCTLLIVIILTLILYMRKVHQNRLLKQLHDSLLAENKNAASVFLSTFAQLDQLNFDQGQYELDMEKLKIKPILLGKFHIICLIST